jgi:hypothetical protein
MASNYERAYNYLRQRGIQVTKAFRPSARIMPLLESSSPSSDDGSPFVFRFFYVQLSFFF